MKQVDPIDFEKLGLSTPSPLVAAILDAVRTATPMNRVGVEAARQAAAQRQTVPKREEVAHAMEHVIGSRSHPFRVRVYRGRDEAAQPMVVYIHAGGWILGDLEHSDHLCRRMANQTGAVVVNVGYRLAPEAPFPAGYDDSMAAFRWARDHAEELGGDLNRMALAGESSGGNQAAAAALSLSAEGEAGLKFLLLLEPAVDVRMSTSSWQEFGEILPPVREQMEWMWSCYAQDEAMKTDPRLSPSLADSIPEMHPPTLVVAAEYDPLRDEAIAYADKLSRSGVAAKARIEQGLPHAFCNMGGVLPEGLRAFDEAIAEMDRALRQQTARRC